MSSFVIDKQEYVKAAGLVSGIVEDKKVWLYDYEANRKSEPADFYKRFVNCYEMNALSVMEQYEDNEPETDSNKYTDVFKAYVAKGKTIATRPQKLTELILDLRQFFEGAKYQTEKEAYYFKMCMYFNAILAAFMPLLSSYKSDCWGSIDC